MPRCSTPRSKRAYFAWCAPVNEILRTTDATEAAAVLDALGITRARSAIIGIDDIDRVDVQHQGPNFPACSQRRLTRHPAQDRGLARCSTSLMLRPALGLRQILAKVRQRRPDAKIANV